MKFNVSIEEYANILKSEKSHERFATKMAEMGFDLKRRKIMKTDYDKCMDMLNDFNDNYLEKIWTAKIGKSGEMIVYRGHAKVFLFNTYEIGLFDFGDNTGDEDLAILEFLDGIRAEIFSDKN